MCRSPHCRGRVSTSWAEGREKQKGGEEGTHGVCALLSCTMRFQICRIFFICEELGERIEASGVRWVEKRL